MALLAPPPEFWTFWGPVLPAVARALNDLQVSTGAQATSWYRDPFHNNAAGGDQCSQHMHGLAADFQHPASVQVAFVARAQALGFIAVPVATATGAPSRTATHVQVLNAGTLRRFGLCPVVA